MGHAPLCPPSIGTMHLFGFIYQDSICLTGSDTIGRLAETMVFDLSGWTVNYKKHNVVLRMNDFE